MITSVLTSDTNPYNIAKVRWVAREKDRYYLARDLDTNKNLPFLQHSRIITDTVQASRLWY